MSPDFLIYHTFDAILGHIPFRLRFVDFHGVACLSLLTRITHLMIDDLVLPDFSDLPHIRCHTRAYFLFG